jgi:hypothetical protein
LPEVCLGHFVIVIRVDVEIHVVKHVFRPHQRLLIGKLGIAGEIQNQFIEINQRRMLRIVLLRQIVHNRILQTLIFNPCVPLKFIEMVLKDICVTNTLELLRKLGLDQPNHALKFDEASQRHPDDPLLVGRLQNKVVVSVLVLQHASLGTEPVCYRNRAVLGVVPSQATFAHVVLVEQLEESISCQVFEEKEGLDAAVLVKFVVPVVRVVSMTVLGLGAEPGFLGNAHLAFGETNHQPHNPRLINRHIPLLLLNDVIRILLLLPGDLDY